MKRFIIGGILPLLLWAVPALCPVTATAQIASGDASRTRQPYGNLEARVETDRTQYGPRRAVELTLTLTNIGERSHVVVGTRPNYDFTIRDVRTGQAVFTLSRNRAQLPRNTFRLNANEERTYQEIWDQTDDAGNRVKPGVYRIDATIYPQNTVSRQIVLSQADGRPERPDRPDRPDAPGGPDAPVADNLRTGLSVDRAEVAPGGTVNLVYTVQNRSNEPMTLRFSDGKRADFTVAAPNGALLWQQSRGMMYTQSFGTLTIPARQSKTFSAAWQVPENAALGRYSLYGFLTPLQTRGDAYLPASVTVLVKQQSATSDVIGGGDGSFNGQVFIQGAAQVSPRILVSAAGSRYVGQKVMLIGKYNGLQGGSGTPPVSKSDWVFGAEGVTLYVSGQTPTVAVGSNISVTGTVKQTADGRIYLQVN